jgi:hypothetical protein
VETHVTPARHAIASRRAAALREGWLRGGGSPAPAGQRRSDWFFCLILAVVTEGFQRALVRRSARAWQDIFGLSWEWNGRRGDSSTRWSGSCRTDSPPDICAFGGYCHRPSYFVPFLLRLRKRGGRLEVAGPIHLWLRPARDQPSPGFGLAGKMPAGPTAKMAVLRCLLFRQGRKKNKTKVYETCGEAPRTMYPNHPAVAFYLELLESCLTGELRPESYVLLQPGKGGSLQIVKRAAVPILQSLLRSLRLELVRRAHYEPSTRREGMDWPALPLAASIRSLSYAACWSSLGRHP